MKKMDFLSAINVIYMMVVLVCVAVASVKGEVISMNVMACLFVISTMWIVDTLKSIKEILEKRQ